MGNKQNSGGVDPEGEVRLELVSEAIALVTLNRPAVRNAVTPALAEKLEGIVGELESNAAVRVAILTGAGEQAFCAGADLREVAAGRLNDCFTKNGGFAGFVNSRRAKPWIAAVNGHALAGGFELVLACDLVIAANHATFGLPEVKRGLIASAGGLYRLPRILPRPVAMELIATGGSITADRAFELGLLNRVVAPEDLLSEALQLASIICDNAPMAVRESVRIARLASGFDDDSLRADGDKAQRLLQQTFDYREGAEAFIEKRQPRWQGR
jgi:enoyl-CoA hydratase/carnithine racemase